MWMIGLVFSLAMRRLSIPLSYLINQYLFIRVKFGQVNKSDREAIAVSFIISPISIPSHVYNKLAYALQKSSNS